LSKIRHLSPSDNEPVEMEFTQFSRLRKLDHSYSAQEDETLVLATQTYVDFYKVGVI